jgi:hypothetical protein
MAIQDEDRPVRGVMPSLQACDHCVAGCQSHDVRGTTEIDRRCVAQARPNARLCTPGSLQIELRIETQTKV